MVTWPGMAGPAVRARWGSLTGPAMKGAAAYLGPAG